MKIDSVLVVCIGNICRSPVGERKLKAELAARGVEIAVSSAGLHAMVDHGADDDAASVAAEHGVSLEGHRARQFTGDLGRKHDIILVMELGHKAQIERMAPGLTGKIFLFDQWPGASAIADPYRRSRECHEAVYRQIDAAAVAWANKLSASAGARR